MIITFDTMVTIWAVRQRASKGQEERLVVAAKILRQITDEGDRLILSAPVVAKYLVDIPPDRHAAQLQELRRSFFIQPFDVHAAAITAKLLANKPLIGAIQNEFEVSRQVVKADVAIVACAIAAKAGTLVSDDAKVRKVAQGEILVKTMDEFLRAE
jgi:hypothetical protein